MLDTQAFYPYANLLFEYILCKMLNQYFGWSIEDIISVEAAPVFYGRKFFYV